MSNAIRTSGLLLFFLVYTRTLKKLFLPPVLNPALTAVEYLAIFLGLLYVAHYIYTRVRVRGAFFTPLELFIIAVLFAPMVSGAMAYLTWGQAFHFGTLTQRHIWLASGGLALLHLLRTEKVSLDEVRSVLLILSWAFVLYLLYLNFTLDRVDFAQERAIYNTWSEFKDKQGERGYRIKLPAYFMVFGLFYYYFLFQEKLRISHFSITVLFLFSILMVIQSRSLMVAIIATMLLFSIDIKNLGRSIFRFIMAVIAVFLVIILYQFYDPEMFASMVRMFENAFTVVLTGEKTDEASANARIKEILLAWPYIKESWLFGNGDISHWWRGGYDVLIGHFYPSDIGWVGIIYVYGIAGLVFFNQQATFLVSYYRKLGAERNQVFTKSLTAFLVYYLIHSITNGMVAFSPYVGILFLVLLAYTSAMHQQRRVTENVF